MTLHEMFRLFILWLLLSFGNADPNISEHNQGFPPRWDLVPGSLSDFKIQNGKIVINPWDYLERMGMYKILLNATEPYLDMTKSGNQRNILWGLPLQFGWQFQTGRLIADSGATGGPNTEKIQTLISGRSWWACMNYYLAVVPFLGALDAGLLQGSAYDIDISHPEEFESDFCYSVTGCQSVTPQAMKEWKTFFEVIKTSSQTSETSIPPLSKEEEQFLAYMWRAHVESINTGLPRCYKRLGYLSVPEGNFGKDWATTVEFLAAVNFPTNFQSTNDFQHFLPHRKLVDGDKVPNVADFTEQQNRVLSTLQLINKVNTYTGGFLLKLWKKAMCSDEAKAEGRNLLQNLVNDPHLAPQTVIKIVMKIVTNPTCK
ncbi:protein LEG1 homolog [Aquarana catesbeiana]|uniref:protein LEG1 homolog n=1 Tax=Aquarana catesbeiana TaxID=8400 RepID=UPI003CC98EA7